MPPEKRPKRSPKKSTALPTPVDTTAELSAPTVVAASAVAAAPDVGSPTADRSEPPAVLTFAAGWRELQQGAITAGGSLVVEYEPARLLEPSVTGDAAPSGEVVGHVRFSPGGQVQSARLLGRKPARRSVRKAPLTPVAAEIPVPAEAEQVELWFQRTDATGSTGWDSRFGENYRYEVVRPASVNA